MAELRGLVIVWLAAKLAGEEWSGPERRHHAREAGEVDWAQQLMRYP